MEDAVEEAEVSYLEEARSYLEGASFLEEPYAFLVEASSLEVVGVHQPCLEVEPFPEEVPFLVEVDREL